jgi:hypothetical protein
LTETFALSNTFGKHWMRISEITIGDEIHLHNKNSTLKHRLAVMSEAIVRAWSGERGAGILREGSRNYYQSLINIKIPLKIEIDGNFLPNILFLVKIGTYYRGCRRPFNPLQWKKLNNFFWSRELYSIQ